MSDLFIKKQAAEFRDKYGIGDEPIHLKSFLLKLGVLTVFKPLNDHISGIAILSEGKRFMVINSNHNTGRQHFTICHELYHLYIQENFTTMACTTGLFDKKNKIEFLADTFAAHLLMPEQGIISMIPKDELDKNNISIATLVKIEQYFSSSRTALLYRLRLMDLITQDEYNKYKTNVKRSAILLGYPLSIYEPGNANLFIGDYGERAKGLFDAGVISESHYVSLMHDIGIDIDQDQFLANGTGCG